MIKKRRLIRLILEDLGQRELARVRSTIGSKTLRAAIRLIINESRMRGRLFIPHYWAIWYHDGRGPVQPKRARKLVFFDNPKDDPRLKQGYPVKRSQVVRLTKEQYQEGLRRNRLRPPGTRPYMYVVDAVGPAAPRPFFTQLAVGAEARAEPIVRQHFERELLKWLDEDKAVQGEMRVAKLNLGL